MLRQAARGSRLRALLAYAALGLACAIAAPAPARAIGIGDALGYSPFWDWKTIETEHFRITYPADLRDVAMKAGNYLEDAHAIMSPLLKWAPSFRTQVVVVDNADTANGLTAAVGRLGLTLFVTPPENWFSTTYYDDWLRLLCVHEYTHYLNMDAATDFWKVLRYAFGDVFLPNAYWYPWMLEGLAVYMETRFTQGGRGRSPYYETLLRAAVAEGSLDDSRFITLDKIGGPNPYYPGGETAYLFGYQLMNEIAHEPAPQDGLAADHGSELKAGPPASPSEDALGEMSIRSAHRVPFFINDNLENIVGKDWYQLWDQWVAETRKRAGEELARIRSQPVTRPERLTQGAFQVLGSAVSPDGKWLAWTQESLDERMSLYLRNLQTGETRRIEEKILGSGVAFSADSRDIIYSSLRRRSEYYVYSDLRAYDIEDGHTDWLTDGLRARDPDLSRDGAWAAFTVTRKAVTGVAVAPVTYFNNLPRLGEIKILYMPEEYGRASNPRFSADGRKIYFSLHSSSRSSEEILEADRETGKIATIVDNGAYNRFPTVDPAGALYFVSDASGTDNLFRYTGQGPLKGEMLTNMETAVLFPSFAPSGELYGSVFATTGSDLARIPLAKTPVPVDVVRVGTAPLPASDASSRPKPADKQYAEKDYSVIPSIWPRQWAVYPFPTLFYSGGAYLAAEVLGFDALDIHSYLLALGYNTQIPRLDHVVAYSNRSLGATITLDTEDYVSGFDATANGISDYTLQIRHSISVSYPILWTYSSLTPSLAFNVERSFLTVPGADPANNDVVLKSAYVPTVNANLSYSSAESSKLAITPEEGRITRLGARLYLDSGQQVLKGIFTDAEYLRLTRHSVLVPSLKTMWVSSLDLNYGTANAAAQGTTQAVGAGLVGTNFDSIKIRGYPNQLFYRRGIATGALDYRFPIAYIYRGWGTNPFFAESLSGFAFAEATGLAGTESVPWVGLPTAGGGLKWVVDLFQVPLVISTQYDYGFRLDRGGGGEVLVDLELGAITF